jgi:hypothetical protein
VPGRRVRSIAKHWMDPHWRQCSHDMRSWSAPFVAQRARSRDPPECRQPHRASHAKGTRLPGFDHGRASMPRSHAVAPSAPRSSPRAQTSREALSYYHTTTGIAGRQRHRISLSPNAGTQPPWQTDDSSGLVILHALGVVVAPANSADWLMGNDRAEAQEQLALTAPSVRSRMPASEPSYNCIARMTVAPNVAQALYVAATGDPIRGESPTMDVGPASSARARQLTP